MRPRRLDRTQRAFRWCDCEQFPDYIHAHTAKVDAKIVTRGTIKYVPPSQRGPFIPKEQT